MCDARCQVVLVVAEHGRIAADLVLAGNPVQHAPVTGEVRKQIGRSAWPAHTPIDPCFTRRIVPASLQRFAAALQEEAVLRIHQLGFLRVEAEECGIPEIDVIEQSTRTNIGRVMPERGGIACLQLIRAEMLDRLPPARMFAQSSSTFRAPGKVPTSR